MSRVSPPLALALSIFALSTSAILVRWSAAPSVVVAFYRVLFTLLLLAPLALVRHRTDLFSLSVRDGAVAAVTGVALAVHFAAWFESLNWTSVAASVTLVQTQPIFVALGAYLLLDERITVRTVGGILLALAGAAVMSVSDLLTDSVFAGTALYGNALALIGGVMAACYVLAGRSLRQRIAVLPYVTVVYTITAAMLLVAALGTGAPMLGLPAETYFWIAASAVFPQAIGHTLLNWGLGHASATSVAMAVRAEPVIATLLAIVVLGEIPPWTAVPGGALVLAGVYLAIRSETTRARGATGGRSDG
ncbi:MAG: DMT family transporter [Euryarchaeota archaeon]|nr:DMT family transporter [Euryarchaeota archaeon]